MRLESEILLNKWYILTGGRGHMSLGTNGTLKSASRGVVAGCDAFIICLSICLSQVGVLLKCLNVESSSIQHNGVTKRIGELHMTFDNIHYGGDTTTLCPKKCSHFLFN